MNCIGIDLGTCLSSVAIIGEHGKPTALRIDTGSSSLIGDSYSIPSSVYIEEDGAVLLGQAADNSRIKNPARYRKEFKRDLGTDEPYHIGDMELFPEDLYKEFLKYFKAKAEEALGASVDKAVISHPANYAGHKKELIRKAALLAGFSQVELVDEPTAASVYYSKKEKIENGQKLLVYDLGGGTFDVSLIVREENGFRPLTPPLGIDKCGGVDFQRKIYEDILDTFSSKLSGILGKRDTIARQFSSMLEGESVKLKHQLSSASSAQTQIMLPPMDFQTYLITREAFENKIGELVRTTCSRVEEIVKNAGLKMRDIDKVILVGGSSRIPFVENMVKKVTGKAVSKDVDTELIVCYGAVIYGNESTPDSLKIQQQDEEFWKRVSVQNTISAYESYINGGTIKKHKAEALAIIEKLRNHLNEERKLYDKGVEHYKAGRYKEALESFNKSIAIKPLMEASNYKGKTLDALKSYEEAIKCYDESIKMDPWFAYSYNNKGTALAKLGRYKEALECYDRSLQLKPDYSLAKDNKKMAEEKLKINEYELTKKNETLKTQLSEEGERLYKEGNYNEAIAKFNAAIDIEASSYLMNYKGLCFAALGKRKEAIEVYDLIIKMYPKDPYVYNNKGCSLEAQGYTKKSLECFDKAVQLEPTDKTFASNKKLAEEKLEKSSKELYDEGVKCYENKEYDKTIDYMNQVIDIKLTVEALSYKGMALDKLKSYDAAMKCYDLAIQKDPKYPYAYNNKGASLEHLGRYTEALDYFNKALEIDSTDSLFISNKRLTLGKINEKKSGVNTSELYNKGVELYNARKYAEALECFDKVVAIAPSKEAHNYRGLTLDDLKRYSEALESYNKALSIDPKYAVVYNNMGVVYHNQGKYEEALKYYYKALDIDPDLEVAKNNKKTALEKVKKPSSGCFLTTAICEIIGKEDSCSELEVLRIFRDKVLLKYPEGELLVKEYYFIAPEIAEALKKHEDRKEIAANVSAIYINSIIQLISQGEKEKAINKYKNMVSYVNKKVKE